MILDVLFDILHTDQLIDLYHELLNGFFNRSGAGIYRTQAQASVLASSGGDCWTHMGHHKPAPLKSVQWTLIMLDTLDGLLRITDEIFGSLFEWVRRSCDPPDKKGLLKVMQLLTLFIYLS